MVEHNVYLKPSSDITADDAGPNISTMRKIWQKATDAELRLQLLQKLKALNLGLAEVEEYVENQASRMKSTKFKDKKDAGLVNEIMERKVFDADQERRDCQVEKDELRREMN